MSLLAVSSGGSTTANAASSTGSSQKNKMNSQKEVLLNYLRQDLLKPFLKEFAVLVMAIMVLLMDSLFVLLVMLFCTPTTSI